MPEPAGKVDQVPRTCTTWLRKNTTAKELARPATTLYQHNLTGILETAVRATNAQFDSPEILKRLDVRLLEVPTLGPGQRPHGGWTPAVVSALVWGVVWRGRGESGPDMPFIPARARHHPDAGRHVDRGVRLCSRTAGAPHAEWV